MVFQAPDEKEVDGHLLGLTLLWKCAHCTTMNASWLVRKEAAQGLKHAYCTSCEGKNLVQFVACDAMSHREKIIQQALPFLPLNEQNQVFEDLAWIEALFVTEGSERIAESYWQSLQRQINYWVQRDQYSGKK
jgi:hypothetical protein